MDSIELFKKVKIGFEELTYDDEDKLDRLTRQLNMLIKNIHGSNSNYLEELMRINYFSISLYANRDEDIACWKSGRRSAINLIDTIIEELSLFSNSGSSHLQGSKSLDCSKVFIVHGHDDGAKNEVARFIEKLGFEAKILHEQIDSGATIIEKLEKHTDVGFAIVLYTACDVGGVRSKPEDLKPRARQNVVFEHGLLIGKIGRANVVALVKGDLEIPNDISGVVYKSMDISGAWKYSIAREMKSSGYDVDMNKVE
ncbi:TIR domain-containing protein [Psychrobacter glacincola]|uniref:TIR domain-containing protein n=1 Tax=Psychrobacter glacincola TaxID=56810 RepID=UPI001919F8E3|nr:nucleotide-binding protein [Psychrobacter glacincola]